MIDRIIVSADEKNMFFEFWPIVSRAWNKFYPQVPISLAFVTDRASDDKLIMKLKEYGEVIIFPPIPGVPSANQAKISRFALASYYADEVCMIEDIDTIPLQQEFVDRVISQRQAGELLCVGYEIYENTQNHGKFPVSNITAEGRVFRQIINPENLSYIGMVKSWENLQVFDHKEAINNEPSSFSDESLLRVLIDRWGGSVRKVRRDVDIQNDWIDRSWWGIDNNKLKDGKYVLCNFLRPYIANIENFFPIIEFVIGSSNVSDVVVLPPLKVLIIQETCINVNDPYPPTVFLLQHSLAKYGHAVDAWGKGLENYSVIPDFSTYDVIVTIESHNKGNWLPDLSSFEYPVKFLWSIDNQNEFYSLRNIFTVGKYDLILQSNQALVDNDSVWFPDVLSMSETAPSSSTKNYGQEGQTDSKGYEFSKNNMYDERAGVLLWLYLKVRSKKGYARTNNINLEVTKNNQKKFVDKDIQVFSGAEAEKKLVKESDNVFLSNHGVISVSRERWLTAQEYEYNTWMKSGLCARDDHNTDNIENLDSCRIIKDHKFKNAIELGCGPFTNIALLEKHLLNIERVTLLDPLINEYKKHPFNRFDSKYYLVNSSIEEYNTDIKYDLLIMINVLEHCFDIPKIFDSVSNLLSPNGTFIFGDICFSQDTVETMSQNIYNAGHPIRINESYMRQFLGKFRRRYLKEFQTTVAGHEATETYFIGNII